MKNYKWVNEIPTEKGLYLVSNSALQQSLNMIQVFQMDGELQVYFPFNETSRRMNVNKVPKRFWWLGKIPYAPHHKYIDDYDNLKPSEVIK